MKHSEWNRPCKRLWLAAVLLLSIWRPTVAGAEVDFEQIEADLKGTYSILLKNGNRQSGRVVSFDENTLRLEVELGGGSAEMNFTADQIAEIRFPGDEYLPLLRQWEDDPRRRDATLNLYRAFYKQRGPFLQYMDQEELELFVRYARFALEQDEALMAVSIINVLRPFIEDEALIRSLDEAKLLGLFRGGMVEEAGQQARDWVEAAEPAGPSALGWSILAEIYFREEDYEKAFWTALYPVAHSGALPTEHLASCYALAISAAGENGQDTVVERLYREMRDRAFEWPTDIPALIGREPDLAATPETVEDAATQASPPNQSPDFEGRSEPSEVGDGEPAPEKPETEPDEPLLPTRLLQHTR